MKKLKDLTDFLMISISKSEIISLNLSHTLKTLNGLLKDDDTIMQFYLQVEVGKNGYDDDSRELWDIPEVKLFIQKLDQQFPYSFDFLTNFRSGLKVVTFSCSNLIKLTSTQVRIEPASLLDF